jgi:hypothetical protein
VRQYFRPRRKGKQFVPLANQRRQFVSRALTLAYLFEAARIVRANISGFLEGILTATHRKATGGAIEERQHSAHHIQ